MKIEKMKWITRSIVRDNPDKMFLFGDNYARSGMGGQAREMRGEPNAYGIATKVKPDNSDGAFFSDAEFLYHATQTMAEFIELKKKLKDGKYTTIVVPEDGLGTGLAQLKTRAPRVLSFINEQIKILGA